jgi:hypothetical protein
LKNWESGRSDRETEASAVSASVKSYFTERAAVFAASRQQFGS